MFRGFMFDGTEYWCENWWKTDLCFQKWYKWFGKFSPEHLKGSKLGLWWDSFIQSRKCMNLKFIGKLCVMTMKNDAKDLRNLTNFDLSTQKSQKLHFNGLPLTKLYNVWAKKVQMIYVWWYWILMQILMENWLLHSKMTREIWKIFTRALESLKIGTLIGFFYPK